MTETNENRPDFIDGYARSVSENYRRAVSEKINYILNNFALDMEKTIKAQFVEMAKEVAEDCLRLRFTGSPLSSETPANQ